MILPLWIIKEHPMRIENDIKLDFSEVLLKPQPSAISSRKQIDLIRNFNNFSAIPLMASNMSSVGTFEAALVLCSKNVMTVLHKHYSVDEYKNFYNSLAILGYDENLVFYSMGIGEKDLAKYHDLVRILGRSPNVCIDIANGYSDAFVDFCEKFRVSVGPDLTIMAGNVVTSDMVEKLVSVGVSIVKVGIGSGCFISGSQVITSTGTKNIENIEIGDFVLTHTGTYEKVTNIFSYDNSKPLISINNVISTDDHEYYVIDKFCEDIVTDENIHEFAMWVSAKELTDNHLLIKHK
jgi:hypothetical protein